MNKYGSMEVYVDSRTPSTWKPAKKEKKRWWSK